jgi:hypothetical protein
MTTLCRFDTKDNGIEMKSLLTFSHPFIPFMHINKVVIENSSLVSLVSLVTGIEK